MVCCYASALGDCSQKQSKEHCLPKGIWRSGIITFEGFKWTDGKAKNLPVKAVSQKILCTTHNSALSHLDGEAQRFFDVGARFLNNLSERGKLKRSAIWKVDRTYFDGFALERLFAKIAVGVLQEEPSFNWHPTGNTGMNPPTEVLEVIFRDQKFQYPMGLYNVNVVGDTIINEDHVRIQTMLHPKTSGFIGAIVAMRHWQFLINLSDLDPTNSRMRSASGQLIGDGGSPPTYHPQTFNFHAKGKLSGQMSINWSSDTGK